MNLASALLKKVVFEARFNSNLMVLDNRGKIHQRWKDEFTEISLNADKMVLKNPVLPSEAFVTATNIGTSFDDVTNLNKYKDLTKKFIQSTSTILELEQFGRAGLRFYYVLPFDHVEQLIKALAGAFCLKADIWKLMGKEKEEIAFSFRMREGDLGIKFSFGSIKRQEKETIPEGREAFYPKFGLLIDVDCYVEKGLAPKEVPNFIDNAERKIKDKLLVLVPKLFGEGQNQWQMAQ